MQIIKHHYIYLDKEYLSRTLLIPVLPYYISAILVYVSDNILFLNQNRPSKCHF